MSVVPFGPGIDIWRSCRFIGAMMRSLCMLPGGLGRFVPVPLVPIIVGFVILVGRSVVMVSLLGRVKVLLYFFLDELLGLFRYPPKSGRALIGGTLPLRYCVARFACSTPTWRLPASGCVRRLVAAHDKAAGGREDEVSGFRVSRVSRSRPLRKRFRLNRKTPAHLVGILAHSRPRVWKRLRQVGFSGLSMPDHSRRRCDHADGGSVHEQDRVGVG